jgi:hypothetical protein
MTWNISSRAEGCSSCVPSFESRRRSRAISPGLSRTDSRTGMRSDRSAIRHKRDPPKRSRRPNHEQARGTGGPWRTTHVRLKGPPRHRDCKRRAGVTVGPARRWSTRPAFVVARACPRRLHGPCSARHPGAAGTLAKALKPARTYQSAVGSARAGLLVPERSGHDGDADAAVGPDRSRRTRERESG